MRAFVLIAAAATIASCTRPVTPPGNDFARVIAGRTAGQPQTCVSTYPNTNIRAVDTQTLAYGNGRTIFINRLAAACPGLDPVGTLFVEAQGSQYCRGDRVRGRELGAIIPGAPCVLNDWVPYRTP